MVEDQEKKDVDDSIKFGKLLANPPPNEEVVISGMSGIFPKARNIDELKECLYNKIDLITPQNRVEFFDPELPDASATVDNDCLSVFDVGYFGKHLKDAMHTDFEQLSTLEKIVEAVMDAGLNISDLENTKTGLFIGKCPGSSDSGMFRVISLSGEGNAFGLMSSMMAAQAASVLKIQGPALLCDTACSSSLIALEHAYRAIRLGECDNAIVAGTNFCLYPGQTLDFKRLGVLSRDGHCKSFEKEGTGYVRAEATCAILLQKSKHAKRIYAQIVHTKSNSDGFKEQGITYPSGDDQFKLIKEIYEECSIPPTKLSYIEAHGTGTPVGDPEECRALENIFLPGRTTPLLVGSVKSNLGHAEPASGLCSVIKSILALESGIICPNLHFTTPRPDIPPLVNGKMKVVTELTELDENNLIGINSFGFGGSNCHVLLKRVDNIKNNESVDNSPRLVCVSGRNKEAVECLLDDISSRELDTDYIGLLHNIFRKNTPQYVFRGFSIVSGTKEICRSIQRISNIQKKVHLIFGEIENWYQLSKGFSNVPIFNKSFQR